MTIWAVALAILVGLVTPAQAQTNGGTGATLPGSCTTGTIFVLTSASPALEICTATNTWTAVGWSGAAGVPSGAIVFVNTGTCPTGYTEVSGLNGKMWRGTIAANNDVGGTGGSDSVTPTFTGTAWTAPAIAWPAGVPTFTGASGTVPAQTFTGSSATSSAVTAGTPAGTNAAITAGTPAGTISALTTGADSSTTGGVAKAIAQTPTFTGSALATHTHTFTGSALATHSHTVTATGTNGTVSFTPTGTVAWPAGVPTIGSFTPAGTISAVDTRAAYIKLIGCSKN